MNLFIYGSGGIGCELCDIVDKINAGGERWRKVAFVDDVRAERNWYNREVFRFDEMLSEKEDYECVIALGEPAFRRSLYEKLSTHGIALATIIDPTAIVSRTANIGKGCIIGPHSFVSSNTRLDDNSMLEIQTVVGHDIYIGRHAVISSCSVLGGNTQVGHESFVGLNCTIKEGIRIGDRCIIGMGSSVFNDIGDGFVALGSPARPARINETHRVFKPR